MFRIDVRWAAAVAALALIDPPAHGCQVSGDESSQQAHDQSLPALADTLNRKCERLNVQDALDIRSFTLRGGLVGWHVYFDRAEMSAELDQRGFEPQMERRERWLAWYRKLNGDLLEVTAEVLREADRDADLFPETDVSVEFLVGDLNTRIFCVACSFRGSRVTYISDPPDGVAKRPQPENAQEPNDVQLELQIVPEKRVWKLRETIHGQLRWKNAGKRRISIRPIEIPRVRIHDRRGQPPPRFDAKIFICGTPVANLPPMVIEPGGVRETLFSIETDPLALGGGVRLQEGAYSLRFPNLHQSHNIPTEVDSVPIQVHREDDQSLTPRIVNFAAGGNRLIVVRENGALDAFDVDSGERVVHRMMDEYVPRYERTEVFSPDGMSVASTRALHGRGSDGRTLEVYRLISGNDECLTIPVPSEIGVYERWRILRFGSDARHAYMGAMSLSRNKNYAFEVDCVTGQITWKAESHRGARVSPDGQYVISTSNPGRDIQVVPRSTPSKLTRIEAVNERSPRAYLLGLKSIYAKWEKDGPTFCYGYDGTKHAVFPADLGEPIAESPDGRFVVFEMGSWLADKPNKLVIWSTDPAAPRYELPSDKRRTPVFTSVPMRLICGIESTDTSFGKVRWFSDTFEVFDLSDGRLLKILNLPTAEENIGTSNRARHQFSSGWDLQTMSPRALNVRVRSTREFKNGRRGTYALGCHFDLCGSGADR